MGIIVAGLIAMAFLYEPSTPPVSIITLIGEYQCIVLYPGDPTPVLQVDEFLLPGIRGPLFVPLR